MRRTVALMPRVSTRLERAFITVVLGETETS